MESSRKAAWKVNIYRLCRNRGTAEQNVANNNKGDIHEVASPIRKVSDTPFSSTKTRATIQGQIEDPEVLALDEEASRTSRRSGARSGAHR